MEKIIKIKKQSGLTPNKSGFTLLEILVTVSIITLILTLGIVSYNQVFITSRDSTRKSDLQIISNTLEQYNSNKGSYPNKTANLSAYLNPVPKDPKTKESYIYIASPSACLTSIDNPPVPPCTSYVLKTTLEKNSETYTINPYGKE
ncbi:MAG: prepilin-type N-terminal cleavage/methylation domain-containing protein [Nanoarchaeota archaeon]